MFNKNKPLGVSRRDFIALSSGAAASTILGAPSISLGQSDQKKKKSPRRAKRSSQPNILFVFSDQERYFNQLPNTFDLPGHNWLAERGTTFAAHNISSTMCTSSRSVLMTGLQTPNSGMFDNVDMAYTNDLSTQTPTLGHMLRLIVENGI
jgi:arylsulfatase